jgi:phage terminase large subunit GpA-like protein
MELLDALGDMAQAWPALMPPNRVTVSEGAAASLRIVRPGGGSGPYNPAETPYMIEPMNMLGNRRVRAVCFVGGSQAGKTAALLDGWMTHAVVNDPGDMLMVQMTQDKAREYSKQRIDRAIRNSPDLRALLGASSSEDNTHDKAFRNGMWLRIAWPTASNMASTSYRYTVGTDYDRWEDNIDGEGDGFSLMQGRSKTFGSRGKNAVESSPGRPLTDPNWSPQTPHEAPPVKGILGIYNRSDRRRYYWPCPHCGEFNQASPGLGLFRLASDDELLESIRTLDIDAYVRDHNRVICSVGCGALIGPEHKRDMNARGVWLADGLTIDAQQRIGGTARTSSIAGYWLGGAAAAYLSWEDMLRKHMQALLEYALTGSELPLQATVNTDQAAPYMSRHLQESTRRAGGHPKDRTEDDLQQYVVPAWARFVVATVDVQGGKNARFIVQVEAIGIDQERAIIDRYAITESAREGYGGPAPLDPAGYAEDWDVLTNKVVLATYRCEGSDREMRVFRTAVDTGGEDGVTERAYAWWRRLRRDGHSQRVVLTKGDKGRYNWLVRESMVGGPKGTKGDVPLKLLNASQFKDQVLNGFKRASPGPGYYHVPTPRSAKFPEGWLLESWFDELFAETRNADGSYTQVKKRNEALDLCGMARALCEILGVNRPRFWASPPAWAQPWDSNSEVITREERRAEKQKAPAVRRSSRSSYLG